MWIRKASVSEPLWKCRKSFQWRRNRGEIRVPGQVWEVPVYGPDGVRHVGGASLVWASAWNVRTCRLDMVAGRVVGDEREYLKRSTP